MRLAKLGEKKGDQKLGSHAGMYLYLKDQKDQKYRRRKKKAKSKTPQWRSGA